MEKNTSATFQRLLFFFSKKKVVKEVARCSLGSALFYLFLPGNHEFLGSGGSLVARLKLKGIDGSFDESSSLGMLLKMGGKFLLKLNIGQRPIAHK